MITDMVCEIGIYPFPITVSCEIRIASGTRRHGSCAVRFILEKGNWISFHLLVIDLIKAVIANETKVNDKVRIRRMMKVFDRF